MSVGQEMVKGFAAEEEQIAKFNAEEEGNKKASWRHCQLRPRKGLFMKSALAQMI